jgi:predicted Rdx family selenoprotein
VAAAILENFDNIEISLIPGSSGIFDVAADEVLFFSKKERKIEKLADVDKEEVCNCLDEFIQHKH